MSAHLKFGIEIILVLSPFENVFMACQNNWQYA